MLYRTQRGITKKISESKYKVKMFRKKEHELCLQMRTVSP